MDPEHKWNRWKSQRPSRTEVFAFNLPLGSFSTMLIRSCANEHMRLPTLCGGGGESDYKLQLFFFLLSKLWSRHVKPSSATVEETYKAKQKILKFVQAEAFPESESCTSQRIAVQACKTELRDTEKHGATQKPTRSPHCKIQSIMNSE